MKSHEKPTWYHEKPWKTMKNHEKPTWYHEKPWKTNLERWKTMKNQPRTMKNHIKPWKIMKNQPGTMKNHENRPGTMKNQPGRVNKNVTDRQTDRTFLLYIDVFPPPVTWILLKVTCNHCRQCDSRQTQTKGHCRNLYVHFGVWRDKTKPNWKGECFLTPNCSFTCFILLP